MVERECVDGYVANKGINVPLKPVQVFLRMQLCLDMVGVLPRKLAARPTLAEFAERRRHLLRYYLPGGDHLYRATDLGECLAFPRSRTIYDFRGDVITPGFAELLGEFGEKRLTRFSGSFV
jgi:hypothetical protein